MKGGVSFFIKRTLNRLAVQINWCISLRSVYCFQPVGSFHCRVSNLRYQRAKFLKRFITRWWTKFQEVPCSNSISWCQSSGFYLFPDLSPSYFLFHFSNTENILIFYTVSDIPKVSAHWFSCLSFTMTCVLVFWDFWVGVNVF